MAVLRYAWLLVPALGLLELGAHHWFARRPPSVAEWRAARPALEAARQGAEPVIVAPYWAEPLARQAFGDAAFPLEQLARPDVSSFARVLEVSLLGQRADETRGWRTLSERQSGKLTLRLLENPAPARVLFDFVSELGPAHTRVTWSDDAPCAYSDGARPAAGGLHGAVAYPARRFSCPGGGESGVGVTVIDDQRYRPRRCVLAHPPDRGALTLSYADVPLGTVIRGYGGLSWFLYRDGKGAPVTLDVRVDGESLGRVVHEDDQGWRGFEVATGAHAGRRAAVQFVITSPGARDRDFCFQADTR